MDQPHLIEHLRANSSLLEPVSTGESSLLASLPGVRAVVFDVYGTLVISGSGDISLAENVDRSPAIVAALQCAGFTVREIAAPWSTAFMEALSRFRTKRQNEGIEFPEVRIEEVWEALVEVARERDWLAGSGDVPLAIVDHECRVNPCWPMPHLDAILRWLGEKNFLLGIVSNAQFYTPLLFPALLGNSLSDYGFDPSLSIWSYKEREGKPSTSLYQKLQDNLTAKGISTEEVLYVGNDLRNDVWPAQRLGFKTALFAGDARSLRWRKDDASCSGVRPDYIITDLDDIRQIVTS